MRVLALVLAAFVCFAAPARAEEPPLTTADPGAYAQSFSDAMTLAGVRPIRDAFVAMIGQQLPADVEQGLRVYETAGLTLPAGVARVIDDISAGDAYRVIYLYHYFGGNAWVFTRIEFARIDERRWAVSRVAFADRWSGVVLSTTPAFAPSTPARR